MPESSQTLSHSTPHRGWILAAFAVWMTMYTGLFAPYFLTGSLGGDYSYFLPKILDEYLFARLNGWLTPQWFSPSFCGGFPGLPNPQSTYWSAPHWFLLLVGPAEAMFATMVAFAALGGLGMYLYVVRIHSAWPAVIAALLFASNGYHIARMLEGHVGHHGFMLTPLIAWLLVSGNVSRRVPSSWWRLAMASLLLAYIVLAAGGPILPQALLAIMILLAYAALHRRTSLPQSLSRFMVSGVVAALCLGPILLSTISFMATNPRGWAALPKFSAIGDSFYYGLAMILAPWRDSVPIREALTTTGVLYEWHELEFGLTVMPVLLALLALAALAVRSKSRAEGDPVAPTRYGSLLLLISLSIAPFLLNIDLGNSFDEFLRGIPILGSTSSYLRWFVLPMVALTLLSASLTQVVLARAGKRTGVAGFTMASITLLTIGFHYAAGIDEEMANRAVRYDSERVERAYHRLRANPAHRIDTIGFRGDLHRNESFLDGQSAQLCYEAAFGYRLEGLRYSTVPGPVSAILGGRYNLINPACYVYPYANTCRPGDRFDADRGDDVRALTTYRPMDFATPRLHDALGNIALLCLAGLGVVLILPLARGRG